MGTIRLVTFSFVTDTLVKVNLSPEGYNAKYWIKLKPNFDNLERNETISYA
ncbi:MAG: hypothetical protein HPY57_12995, partial [Ignavibacteria bacterium]|nr:hypothetical protein [Ignavibacteria bacterium]